MKRALFLKPREWKRPSVEQWVINVALTVLAAEIASAVPHTTGIWHQAFLIALCAVCGGYVIASMIVGGGR